MNPSCLPDTEQNHCTQECQNGGNIHRGNIASLHPACRFIFDLVLQLHWQPEQLDSVSLLKQQAIQTIETLSGSQMTADDLLSVRYALVALLDERVAYSAWSAKQQWLAQPLQLALFGDHLAGEKFFERLVTLQQTVSTSLPILEIYYLCLQLGFQGKYRLHNPNVLIELKHQLSQQLLKQQTVERMNPSAMPRSNIPPSHRRHGIRQPFKLYGWALGILGLVYVGYHWAIWQLKQSFM